MSQESHSPRPNGEHMSMEARDRESLNGERLDKPGSSGVKPPNERPPSRSGSSSSRSTPSLKTKDVSINVCKGGLLKIVKSASASIILPK